MRATLRLTPLLLALLFGGAASAEEIGGFTIVKLSGNNVSLSSRFTPVGIDDERFINRNDCFDYLGLSASYCGVTTSSSATSTTDAGSTVTDAAGPTADTMAATDTVTSSDAPTSKPGGGPAFAPGKTDAATDPSFTISVSVDSTYANFGVAVGTGCTTTQWPFDTSTASTDTCRMVRNFSRWDNPWSDMEFTVPMTDMLVAGCGVDQTPTVYFYADQDGVQTLFVSEVKWTLDVTAPAAPVQSDPAAGDQNVTVKFAEPANATGFEYSVYYAGSEFTTADIQSGGISSVANKTSTEVQVTGLTNNQPYYFGVVAIDPAGNESELCSGSNLTTATPIAVDDFYEYYKHQGGREVGGYGECSIGRPTTTGAGLVFGVLLLLMLMRRREAIR